MSYLYGIFAVAGWIWLVIIAPLFILAVRRHDRRVRPRGFGVIERDTTP